MRENGAHRDDRIHTDVGSRTMVLPEVVRHSEPRSKGLTCNRAHRRPQLWSFGGLSHLQSVLSRTTRRLSRRHALSTRTGAAKSRLGHILTHQYYYTWSLEAALAAHERWGTFVLHTAESFLLSSFFQARCLLLRQYSTLFSQRHRF